MKIGKRHRAAKSVAQCISLEGGSLPPMISYAQNFEDVILRRALQDIAAGFYVDIGAYDATADSVTRWFYDQGWRGVNVEPVPAFFAGIDRDRPEDSNVLAAVTAQSGTTRINVIDGTGLSTISPDHVSIAADRGYAVTSRIEVPAFSLDDLLVMYTAGHVVDFLKIDAEGSEAAILTSARLEVCRPRIILVEAVTPFQNLPAWRSWEPALLSRGYRFAWFDGLNRFYVRTEDEWRLRLFGTPPCVFDSFTHYLHRAALDRLAAHEAAAERNKADAEAALASLTSLQRQHEDLTCELRTRLSAAESELAVRESAMDELRTRNAALTADDEAEMRDRLLETAAQLREVRERLIARDHDYRQLMESQAVLEQQRTSAAAHAEAADAQVAELQARAAAQDAERERLVSVMTDLKVQLSRARAAEAYLRRLATVQSRQEILPASIISPLRSIPAHSSAD